ncbi:MAG: KpsF/GutQ family sugar-phosphate isomerase [Flavobacteriales bacterium]|nr:D-arabinose 5-phosphate isomerase [Flavobacteriales bacterium]MDG1917100.1 KpsF/GutQ family sugar-phosphate isomerase [Flavobacteriales bacterium]
MKSISEIKSIAISTISLEGQSILHLKEYIDDTFSEIVNAILESKGRLIVSGIGKSANIAQKIVSTFNSTGQPAVFMHAGDAIHGDLGNVQPNDIVLCISKSGNTDEIKVLVPLIKKMNNKLIAMTANSDSYLSEQANWTIKTSVEKEACPNNLAPTTSTTAQLVMGDALAICLLECRDFSDADFARYHPGGTLGKRLFLKAGDLCSQDLSPQVLPSSTINEVIVEISNKRQGATAVIDKNKLLGIITDGDIRRMLESEADWSKVKAVDIMNTNPKTVSYDELATSSLKIMEQNNISQIIVLKESNYFGIVHIHDILKEGLV